MIDDPNVDVIYNPLPNGLHFEWTMKALKGGKYVLLEKLATNTADEASQIYALAERKGLVVLEAFHYRSVFDSTFIVQVLNYHHQFSSSYSAREGNFGQSRARSYQKYLGCPHCAFWNGQRR